MDPAKTVLGLLGSTMSMSPQKAGLAIVLASSLAIPAEGLYYTWYPDPVGIATVCYGHTASVDKGKRYTKDECLTLLSVDMANAVKQVDKCVPDLPLGVLAAFSDAVYNMGPKIACDTKNSRAATMLHLRDYFGACNQLPRWNKARIGDVLRELLGLTIRRTAEQEMCLKDAV